MTAPPVLELRADALDKPDTLDLAVVEAMMLWPDDEAARARWMVAAMVEWGWARIEHLPEADLRRWALNARAARGRPTLADLRSEADARGAHGLIAGAIVQEATILGQLGSDRAALGNVQESLADRLGRLKGSFPKEVFPIRPRTMNNRAGPIYRFRPVAHLWAAHLTGCDAGGETFPCKVSRLAEFLATAEAIRARAERSRVKKAPSKVMRPGEAARLPDAIVAALPAVSLPEYALRSSPG